jgi:hypothetical protein
MEQAMKITIDGKEFELHELTLEAGGTIENIEPIYALKPVKKTEKNWLKIEVIFDNGPDFHDSATDLLKMKAIKVNPPTANKLSEAISALVEYMQGEPNIMEVNDKANLARESYQESQ